MKRQLITVALAGLVPILAGAALPEKLGARDYVEATLLLSGEHANIRLAAKSISSVGSSSAVLDLVAELAWDGCTGRRALDPDALSWLAIALGDSGDARYASLLDDCLARITDKKTIKYVTLSRKKLEGPAGSPFAGGVVDIDKLRARLPGDGAASRTAAPARFRELRRGWTIDETAAVIGLPASVTPIDVHENEFEEIESLVKGDISSEMIVLAYPGVGSMRFSVEKSRKTWILIDAASDQGLYWLTPAGRLGDVTELIAEGGGRVLREYSQSLAAGPTPDSATLDRVAARILASRAESDSNTVDALAHLCKVLGKSGNGKYKSVLLEISDTASRRALRKHARLGAERLPDSEEKFVPVGACKACGE